MSLDPCALDPGTPLCQSGHTVDAPEVDALIWKAGLFLLLGVLVVVVLVVVFWKSDRDSDHGFG